MKFVLIVSSLYLLAIASNISLPTGRSINHNLYHLVCNVTNIQRLSYYPIVDGKVDGERVFDPIEVHLDKLTNAADEYITPICNRSENQQDISHEWFISSQNFTQSTQVII